ncbi:hypothetical protein LZ30DRAFT_357312 [Colletotrichum cereale]|nr:hypothetical protein LZ30DRAFT_357312 [Colletotrichum cereale]
MKEQPNPAISSDKPPQIDQDASRAKNTPKAEWLRAPPPPAIVYSTIRLQIVFAVASWMLESYPAIMTVQTMPQRDIRRSWDVSTPSVACFFFFFFFFFFTLSYAAFSPPLPFALGRLVSVGLCRISSASDGTGTRIVAVMRAVTLCTGTRERERQRDDVVKFGAA